MCGCGCGILCVMVFYGGVGWFLWDVVFCGRFYGWDGILRCVVFYFVGAIFLDVL